MGEEGEGSNHLRGGTQREDEKSELEGKREGFLFGMAFSVSGEEGKGRRKGGSCPLTLLGGV